MKQLLQFTAAALIGVMGASCTTSYDSYGNRRQAVDPAGAAIGAVALGALAYSIGKNRGERHERNRRAVRHYNNTDWGHNVQPGWGHPVYNGGRYCR